MIVPDASAIVEALVGQAPPEELLGLLGLLAGDVHAPHLLDVGMTSVPRGLDLAHAITPERARQALDAYWSFTIERHELEPPGGRTWELRHQLTSHDAAYLALAEALESPVVTCDRKLQTNGHRATVRLMSRKT